MRRMSEHQRRADPRVPHPRRRGGFFFLQAKEKPRRDAGSKFALALSGLGALSAVVIGLHNKYQKNPPLCG